MHELIVDSLNETLEIWVNHCPNISHMKNCNDPNLGDVLCKLTFFYSPDSELYLLNGFVFAFFLMA